VLLCGVRTQPSRGDEYKSAFAAMSLVLPASTMCCSTRLSTMRLWTMLSSSCRTACNPTAAGIEAVVTRILPKVEVLIDRARHRDR